jgi:hypothetical protein
MHEGDDRAREMNGGLDDCKREAARAGSKTR